MSILIFIIISYILLSISLYMLFPKAGVPAVKGLIPGVNFIEWAKLIGRKPIYVLWLLVPIVNFFVFAGMCIDLARSFGRSSFVDAVLSVVYPPAMFAMIAKGKNEYEGPVLEKERAYKEKLQEVIKSGNQFEITKMKNKNPFKKNPVREWVESIIFAVFAAAFIRMFLIEAYVIPTPSMEGSLNVGDFLFVSKPHYGLRTPMTVAMVPLLHNRIPFLNTESYIKSPSLPYFRLPAIEKIKNGEPFVFNWPVGDSIYLAPDRSFAASQLKNDYNSYTKEQLRGMTYQDYLKTRGCNKLIVRPIDKKDHYIKRAVGIAGDSLKIIDGLVYINGKPEKVPKHRQFKYNVQLPKNAVVHTKKLDKIGIDFGDSAMKYEAKVTRLFQLSNRDKLFLDDEQVKQLKDMYPEAVIERIKTNPRPLTIFPSSKKFFTDWTMDDYGPVYIPKKGDEIVLTPKNVTMYNRLITVYEGNKLTKKGSQYYINGKPAKKYKVKQDYYWAMGDNRHNSEDSRAWGFVPFDHVVGKPLFIWFSTKEGNIRNGINWDRIFKSASED